MNKKKFVQNVTIIVLAVAIIAMSVGYAIYYQPLQINGTARIQSAAWDIHFNNVTKTANSNVADSALTGPTLTNGTSLSFDVALSLGDTYEFTVDVVNDGTFDAALSAASLTGTKNGTALSISDTSYSNEYLTYSVSYADGTAIKANDTLTSKTTKKLLVTVSYQQPADNADLPSTAETYSFTLNLNYNQA